MFLFLIVSNLMSLNRVADQDSQSVNINARILLEQRNLVIFESLGSSQAAVWNTENCGNMFYANNAAQRNLDAKVSFLSALRVAGLLVIS
jgi:hypothetical protein